MIGKLRGASLTWAVDGGSVCARGYCEGSLGEDYEIAVHLSPISPAHDSARLLARTCNCSHYQGTVQAAGRREPRWGPIGSAS